MSPTQLHAPSGGSSMVDHHHGKNSASSSTGCSHTVVTLLKQLSGLMLCLFVIQQLTVDMKVSNFVTTTTTPWFDAACTSIVDMTGSSPYDKWIVRTSYKEPTIHKRKKKNKQQQSAVVCAIAKHEAPYIDEWVDYNIGIGFHSIYLYDNTDRYELEQWGIAQTVSKRPIYVQHKPGWSHQCEAYYECAQTALSNNHTWALFYDIDEFLVVQPTPIRDTKKSTTTTITPTTTGEKDEIDYSFHVLDFANKYIRQGSLSLNWEIFGTSGKQVYEPIPILKRFQYKVPINYTRNSLIKSFVKLNDMNLSKPCKDPHFFPLKHGKTQRLPNNQIVKGSINFINTRSIASIYHIMFKSYEEYISKRSRGAGFFGNRTISSLTKQALENIGPDGNVLPVGEIYDDTAWKVLITVAPKYKVYNALVPPSQTSQQSIARPYNVHYNASSPSS